MTSRNATSTVERGAGRQFDRVVGLVIGLAAVQALIAAINLSPLIERYAVAEILDLNAEATLPAWLSSSLLFSIAAAAAAGGASDDQIGKALDNAHADTALDSINPDDWWGGK